jgi:NAD+ diphosphatase
VTTESKDLPVFTGVALDRAYPQRGDPAWVSGQLSAPGAVAVVAGRDRVLVDHGGEALLRVPLPRDVAAGILLGLSDGTPLFAVDLEGMDAGSFGGREMSLREAGSMLARAEGGLAAYAVALLNWHRRHRYCANCGHATDMTEAGGARSCPNCGAQHFPRTDPVVIMLVEHAGAVLLGRRAGWPGRRYSVLAGFVAPGESLEEAVAREVREESGIVVRDPRFVASQPWPFPASLMLGFNATADGGEPAPGDGELEEVRWFTRDEVLAIRDERSSMALPPPVSIARFLLDRWLAGAGEL